MKREKGLPAKIAVLSLLFLLTASFLSAGGKQEAKAASGNEILKIGFAFDLTGPGAEWFVPFGNALEMEFDEINKKGGIEVAGKKYDLKLIKETTNFTAEGAKAAAEKLVYKDKVKIIWGAGILHTTMALQDVTMPNKVLNLSAGWGREVLSGKLVDGKIKNPYKYTIAIVATSYETTPGMWKWVKEKYPTYTRVADITINTEASHWAVEDVELKLLPELGFTPVIQEFYEVGLNDFYPILSKVLEKNPDVIHCSNSPPNEWSLIMKQAREMGFKGLFFREEMASSDIFKIAGKENVEGLVGWDFPVFGDLAVPEYLDFKKRYTERYGVWHQYSPVPIRMLPPLIEAMKIAGTVDDVDKIIATLTSRTWKSYGQEMMFGGAQYYGIPNMSATPLVVTQVQNGEFVPVGTISDEDQLKYWE